MTPPLHPDAVRLVADADQLAQELVAGLPELLAAYRELVDAFARLDGTTAATRRCLCSSRLLELPSTRALARLQQHTLQAAELLAALAARLDPALAAGVASRIPADAMGRGAGAIVERLLGPVRGRTDAGIAQQLAATAADVLRARWVDTSAASGSPPAGSENLLALRYHPEKGLADADVWAEGIQVAAVAIRVVTEGVAGLPYSPREVVR